MGKGRSSWPCAAAEAGAGDGGVGVKHSGNGAGAVLAGCVGAVGGGSGTDETGAAVANFAAGSPLPTSAQELSTEEDDVELQRIKNAVGSSAASESDVSPNPVDATARVKSSGEHSSDECVVNGRCDGEGTGSFSHGCG